MQNLKLKPMTSFIPRIPRDYYDGVYFVKELYSIDMIRQIVHNSLLYHRSRKLCNFASIDGIRWNVFHGNKEQFQITIYKGFDYVNLETYLVEYCPITGETQKYCNLRDRLIDFTMEKIVKEKIE